MKQLIESKSIKIEKKEKEILLKIINRYNMKEFNMSIPLKEKDLKSEVNSLNTYVFQLNEKIEKLEKRVGCLENELNDYKIKFNEFKKEYENSKKENHFMFNNSSIIRKEEEDFILGWMEKKPKKFKLLLDSNIDGDSTSTFYNKCSKKCPIIVFVKTTNGYRFGGYTSQFWPSSSYKKDDKSFLFSLDLKSKYKCIKLEWAIYYDYSYFSFGKNLYIYNNCTTNKNSSLSPPYSYEIPKIMN